MFSKVVEQGFPGGKKTWALGWLALLSEIVLPEVTEVIDFTRYDVPAREPASRSTRNWSLMGEIYQKRTRLQDKPLPINQMNDDKKGRIVKKYPDLLSSLTDSHP